MNMFICCCHILVILILHHLSWKKETENDFSLALVIQNSSGFSQLLV